VIVVSDTSPPNYLIRLGHVDVLRQLYTEVVIPTAVHRELLHDRAPLPVHAWAASLPPWVRVQPVRHLDPTLDPLLGVGEREAISLAVDRGASILLIDDGPGRHAARIRHLEIAGTLGVLVKAAREGLLSFPEELRRLKQIQFRCTPEVEREMLRLSRLPAE
jgi:predicted nucleic acid-binding protein